MLARGEGFVVDAHQLRLAHGRHRLQRGRIGRSGPAAQGGPPRRDGPRADQHDAVAQGADLGHLRAQPVDGDGVHTAGVARDRRGPDLGHHGACRRVGHLAAPRSLRPPRLVSGRRSRRHRRLDPVLALVGEAQLAQVHDIAVAHPGAHQGALHPETPQAALDVVHRVGVVEVRQRHGPKGEPAQHHERPVVGACHLDLLRERPVDHDRPVAAPPRPSGPRPPWRPAGPASSGIPAP